LLDAIDALAMGVLTGELEAVEPLLTSIPDLGSAADAAAPPEIAEAVATWVEQFPDIAAALTDTDLTDLEAMDEALSGIDTEASDGARAEVAAWAADNCGWVSAADFGAGSPSDSSTAELGPLDVPEPADCETLDAAAAAEAAGLDVDVTDLDGTGDFNLPGFWTKSCSYGNGAISLSTMSFNSIEAAEQFYADTLDDAAGRVGTGPLGSLPESSLVIHTGVAADTASSVPGTDHGAPAVAATVQVVVFEAPIPFSVSVPGADTDPATVVAAAEAVLNAMSADDTSPATTAATATTT
jgi:hypothetical protein